MRVDRQVGQGHAREGGVEGLDDGDDVRVQRLGHHAPLHALLQRTAAAGGQGEEGPKIILEGAQKEFKSNLKGL